MLCLFCLSCDACSCRCSYIGRMFVSSCKCYMFVSCVHPVAVSNATFCMTCSLLVLVEDVTAYYIEEACSRDVLMTAL